MSVVWLTRHEWPLPWRQGRLTKRGFGQEGCFNIYEKWRTLAEDADESYRDDIKVVINDILWFILFDYVGRP